MAYRNRILIVDDDSILLNQVEGILRNTYETVPMTSGHDAVEYLKSAVRMDLMILDIMMPHMDGYELIDNIRHLPVCRDVPIIFLTGKSGPDEEIKGLNAGVVDYIVKPVLPEVLCARVAAKLRAAKRLNMEKLSGLTEPLSDIELAVLQLMALSLSNDDISDRMGYSYGYTRQIVSKLIQKTGVGNRKDIREFLA